MCWSRNLSFADMSLYLCRSDVNNMDFVLDTLSTNWLSFSHSDNDFRSSLIRSSISSMRFPEQYRAVSSAYRLIKQCCIHCGRSLMYIININGPKIELWGTPQTTSCSSEFCVSIHTNCFRSLRWSLNQKRLWKFTGMYCKTRFVYIYCQRYKSKWISRF